MSNIMDTTAIIINALIAFFPKASCASTFSLTSFSYSFLILFSSVYYSEFMLPLLYIIFTFTDAASAYPFGRASDRVGRKPILILGFLFLAVTAAWSFIANDWLAVIPMFVFFGLSAGALTPVQTTLVADLVEPERRASIIGAYQMIVGIIALPAGIIIGWLWDTSGPILAFTFSLVLALIAVLCMMPIKISKPGESSL